MKGVMLYERRFFYEISTSRRSVHFEEVTIETRHWKIKRLFDDQYRYERQANRNSINILYD